MNGPMYIPISANALSTAAELARQCSATTVRERVFVSQVVALAVREYLHRTAGIQTGAGRSAALKYFELLDICDFNASDWRVEMRVVTHVERLALYVPTVPLMVGVLSDFYVGAQVEKDPAISGDLLSAVISIGYILGFRKYNPNVFNMLAQNRPCF